MSYSKAPLSIRNHKYAWLFAPEWQMVHNRKDGNSFTFFIGGNGTGKTYADLTRMEILGVDENDSYGRLFDPDHLENHLFFDKQVMLNKIAEIEKWRPAKRKGYMITLDEAQMTANAKQWNDKQVLEFSKEMTTIRSSRFSISLTMPTHRMITTDLRQLGTYQVEMFPADKIDKSKGIAYSKLHILALKPHLGEVWRHRPYLKQKFINTITGLTTIKGGLLNEFTWVMPSRTTRKNYERLKREYRKQSSENKANAKMEDKKKQFKFDDWLDEARKNKEKYRDSKKVFAWNLVQKDLHCGVSSCYKIVKILKEEEGYGG